MSYDLYFMPRFGDLLERNFVDYFAARSNYRIANSQAWYENEDTGVYFAFERERDGADESSHDDPTSRYAASFNINFYRPSYFILEAESEVTAFVRQFDLVVFDPQTHGIGEGEYQPDGLISGWHHGNRFACSTLSDQSGDRNAIASLPSRRLAEIWSWNRNRQGLQTSIGESMFVPKVVFLRRNEGVLTAAAWPDAIPAILPKVDLLLIPRQELAPRRFWSRKEDIAVASWTDVAQLLMKHGSHHASGGLALGYQNPPDEIVRLVQALPADQQSFTGISADQVLDQELVQRAA